MGTFTGRGEHPRVHPFCSKVYMAIYEVTPLKFNMEPENEGLEDYFPFQLGDS